MTTRVLLFVSILIASLLFLSGAGVVSYWLFEPEVAVVSLLEWNTVDANGQVKTKFRRGEVVRSWRRVNAMRSVTHSRVWRIVVASSRNTTIAEYRLESIPAPKGISERTVKLIEVPKDAPFDTYYVMTYGTYALNPLRDVTYELLPRVTFEVVP